MESRTSQLLEFPKVLSALSGLAVSQPGREACLSIRPLASLDEVLARTATMAEAMVWSSQRSFSLGDFPALDGVFPFVLREHDALDLDGLWAVFEVLDRGRELKEALDQAPSAVFPRLRALVLETAWPEKSHSGLKRCLAQDGGRLRDEASPELFSTRQEIRSLHQRCTKKVKDFVQAEGITPYLQDEFMTISSDRYVLPLKTNFKGRVQGIVHDYSQTGETCYFEPYFLVDVNNELQDLKREEREEERRIMAYLTGLIRFELDLVRSVFDTLVQVDVLLAQAAMGRRFEGRLLTMGQDEPLNLVKARHPLLALQGKVRPTNIELEPGQRVLIITGGNAGGKTVCLKTLGLIAMMAQAGMPVPVDEGSTLPHWSDIFVFIGDEQSLEDHVSTFTGQIQHLGRVWPRVEQGSLVLLDEFGTGTDPTQGAALAQAVIDAILERGAYALAATHFPALKVYGLSRDGVRAASVLFDPATKKPIYQLAYDQVGSSLALDVARDNGLPQEILSRAEQYLLVDSADTSKVIDKLNAMAVKREQEIIRLGKERLDYETRRKSLAERFEAEKKRLLTEVRSASQDILRQWQEGKLARKEALKNLARERDKLATPSAEVAGGEPEASAKLSLEVVQVGESYRYLPWDKQAVVGEKDERKRLVKVDMGGVGLWVKPEDLAPLDAPSRPQGSVGSAATRGPAPGGRFISVDLRGMRGDEAVAELARFLDSALLGGMDEVEVIHGRGTGALRREVHAFLKTSPAVERYTLAPEDRGGDGMTIVELK